MNNSSSLLKTGFPGKQLLQFLVLLLVTFIVHAFVLRFIFPGFYKPLSIQHEDHYIPTAFAHALVPGYHDLMNWPRPVFMIFYKLIGHAGTSGAIGFVIGLAFINCVMSALLIKGILGLPFNGSFLFFYIIYCYLLFATPYFYILYTQDTGSYLSYFFLILGAILFYQNRNSAPVLPAGLLLICCILAFLSKETYQLLALFFSFLWFLYDRKTSLKRSLIPMGATVVAFIISAANNMRLKSVFVNVNAPKGSPYGVSLSPFSVAHEWIGYARDGINIADLLMIGLIGYMVLRFKKPWSRQLLFIFVACFLAAGISWLPNAALPNHHINGYSFNGLYLFYLPLFFIPFLQKEKLITNLAAIVVVALCLTSYRFNVHKYRGSSNNWAIQQENTERNFVHSLDSLIGQLTPAPKPQRVLISGITFPFHPFTYPQSLREYPHAAYALYDVVYYTPNPRYVERNDLVRFIPPSDSSLVRYDHVWIFKEDGSLAGSIGGQSAKKRAVDSNGIAINLQNLPDLKTVGIYPPEDQNGIAWTNGNAGIDLPTPIRGKDSLTVILDTYMGRACKNIVPRLALSDTAGKVYQPVRTERKQDVFYFHFAPGKRTYIKKVTISSQQIDSGPDKRILSFPMKGLVIK
jgi:hypothetical protein